MPALSAKGAARLRTQEQLATKLLRGRQFTAKPVGTQALRPLEDGCQRGNVPMRQEDSQRLGRLPHPHEV